MIALLHYLYLKGVRDRSLIIFLLIGPVWATIMLIAVAIALHHVHYPLGPELPIKEEIFFSGVLGSWVASISAFWSLRSELATKAVSSFLLARRPISIAVALVIFATATGVASIVGAVICAGVLWAAVPPGLFSIAFALVIVSLASASLGALYVTISPQPMMFVWAQIAGIPLAPWLVNPSNWPRLMMIAPVVTIVCTVVSAFLLERRCAT